MTSAAPEQERTTIADHPGDGIEGTARAPDGLMLRTLRWPAAGTPWASLLIVHGLGEHAGRYRHVARQMAGSGIEAWGYDQRGFGGSAGPRAYIPRWARFHEDLGSRLDALRGALPDIPLVLFGHSMGGLVALGYALREPRPALPDLLVLSAPGLASTVPEWKFVLARSLSPLAPRLRIRNGFAADTLSRDPTVGERARADPLCMDRTSLRFAVEAEREQKRVRAAMAGGVPLPVPTYVLHGTHDAIVPVAASEVFEGRPNATRRMYPGLRHELHNEPEGPQVVADVIAWIRARTEVGRPRV